MRTLTIVSIAVLHVLAATATAQEEAKDRIVPKLERLLKANRTKEAEQLAEKVYGEERCEGTSSVGVEPPAVVADIAARWLLRREALAVLPQHRTRRATEQSGDTAGQGGPLARAPRGPRLGSISRRGGGSLLGDQVRAARRRRCVGPGQPRVNHTS